MTLIRRFIVDLAASSMKLSSDTLIRISYGKRHWNEMMKRAERVGLIWVIGNVRMVELVFNSILLVFPLVTMFITA